MKQNVHLYYTLRMANEVDEEILHKYLQVYIKCKMREQVELQQITKVDKIGSNTPDTIKHGMENIHAMVHSRRKEDTYHENWYMFLGQGDIEKYSDVFVILLLKENPHTQCMYNVYKHKLDLSTDLDKEEKLKTLSQVTKCLDYMFEQNNTSKLTSHSRQ